MSQAGESRTAGEEGAWEDGTRWKGADARASDGGYVAVVTGK